MWAARLFSLYNFFISIRSRHTRFRNVTAVQTCALPIWIMSFTNIYSTKANVAYDPYSVIIGNGTSGSILQTTSTNAVWQSTGTYSITADPWNSSKNPVKLTSKGMELPEHGDVTFGNVSLKQNLESIWIKVGHTSTWSTVRSRLGRTTSFGRCLP